MQEFHLSSRFIVFVTTTTTAKISRIQFFKQKKTDNFRLYPANQRRWTLFQNSQNSVVTSSLKAPPPGHVIPWRHSAIVFKGNWIELILIKLSYATEEREDEDEEKEEDEEAIIQVWQIEGLHCCFCWAIINSTRCNWFITITLIRWWF